MSKLVSTLTMGIAALVLAACGGDTGVGKLGSGGGTGGTGSNTGNGGSNTPPPVYSLGNGTGTSFKAGMIGLSTTTVSAGGSTSLSITIVDQTGTLYATNTGVAVTLNSPCIASGTAEISEGSAQNVVSITTNNGTVNAVYNARGCSGSDVITATASVGSQNLTASGTVTVAASTVGSIQFVSATPSTVGLKGTGLNETSTVIFKVLDSTGGPRANATVNFSLDTTAGGITLSPATATSANDGTVQTVVSAGTVHTAVRVTANITSPALSTQSSVLTITTGLPTSNAFTLSIGAPSYAPQGQACSNVEAYTLTQITAPFTVQLADRYANPVPDGTAVTFTTSGGVIVGSCTTGTPNPGSGSCSVTWTSANPIPTPQTAPPSFKNGRAMILATAIGEEYFDDVSASGYYIQGDAFSDLGEPYRDDNENGKYDLGEHYLDFNHNGTRDGPSGQFVGITCTGSTPGSTCSTSTLAIGAQHLLIMSTSGAQIGNLPGAITVAHGTSTSFTFTVQDQNSNPMAAGTTVSAGATGGSVSGTGASWTIGCRTGGGPDLTNPAADALGLTFTAGANPGAGSITITVTSPGTHTSTVATIPVTIT